MITDIEDFFAHGCGRCARFATADCSARQWADGLKELRRICLAAGLSETVKWGHPCYMHGDRNIAVLGAFRNDCRITFFNAALLKDPEGVLERQGPNTRHPNMIRFLDNARVAEQESVLTSYLREATGYADAGLKPPKDAVDFDLPEEFLDALDADPDLNEAFQALTPGRRRSYAINLNGAKKSETRIARIAKFRGRILSGKGANER
ncbi:YdeI/OmpD-associated family protein [Roseibium sp.]|uniref:YdeI/OmpD-associated family protein n=1 Tax=Roseibium sp. TaxID=1936156 RepID=UPI003D0C9B86